MATFSLGDDRQTLRYLEQKRFSKMYLVAHVGRDRI